MSSLHQVLSAYSVPLQIWLSPESRSRVADALIANMGSKATILVDPLPQLEQLRGPAVLVITAGEMKGANQPALRLLADKAHPGRSVLVGGTSDRDTLMDAINNWGVVRVIANDSEDESIVDAVHAAGRYLNREVAMETAIDDLDIETTMLESAIDQLEGSRERNRQVDRNNITSTFSAGMVQILERERELLSAIETDLPHEQRAVLRKTMEGIDTLAEVIERSHLYGIEKAAGLAPETEALDPLVEEIRTLVGPNIGGHIGSGAAVAIDPFPLFHALISICRTPSLGDLKTIDTHKSGTRAVTSLTFCGPLPDDFLEEFMRSAPTSWEAIQAAGGEFCAVSNPNEYANIELTLPAQEPDHV